MPKQLNNYNCRRENCCILNKQNSAYSVYGKAKGVKTNYRLNNNSKCVVRQFTIDDCVLAEFEEAQKCDFLFIAEKGGVRNGYFIEMKGQDFLHACRQILNSIEELSENIDGKLFARIITTKFSVPKYQQNKSYRTLKRALGENFDHKNILFEDTI